MANIPEHVERENVYALLRVLQSYAPNGPAQLRLAKYLMSMQSDGATYSEQVKSLSGVLNDGLRTGNWPWVIDPEGR